MRMFSMLMASALVLAMPGAVSAQVFNTDTTGQTPDPFGFPIPTVVVPFYTTVGGTYNFLQEGDFDTFLFIYQDFLDPTAPGLNLIGLNDDIAFPTNTNSMVELSLDPNRQYFALLSGAFSDEFGLTTLTVRGQADVTFDSLPAVPEPATWGLMIAGFALTGAAMRRRATSVSYA